MGPCLEPLHRWQGTVLVCLPNKVGCFCDFVHSDLYHLQWLANREVFPGDAQQVPLAQEEDVFGGGPVQSTQVLR